MSLNTTLALCVFSETWGGRIIQFWGGGGGKRFLCSDLKQSNNMMYITAEAKGK